MARLFNGTSDRATAAVALAGFSVLSLSFWMWVDAFSGASRDSITYGSPTSSGAGFLIEPFDTQPLVVGMFKPGAVWADNLATPPSAAAWHHYLYVGDRTGPTNTLYVDGSLKTLTTFAHQGSGYGNYASAGSTTLELGTYNATQFFSGRLAEVVIWGGVTLGLAAAKALAAGASPLSVHPGSVSAYYPLFGKDSPEPDYSGKQANATLTGTSYTAPPGVQAGIILPNRVGQGGPV